MRPRLRSLQNRLALLFFAITALGFAAVIFFFLPQLQTRLQNQRLQDLQGAVASLDPRLATVMGRDITGRELDGLVRAVGDSANARLTLLGVQQSSTAPRGFYPISDSNADRTVSPDYALAAKAVRLTRPGQTATRRLRDAVEVAAPLFYRGRPAWIAVYSRRSDAGEFVRLVRDRLLEASGVALVIAVISGFFVARAIANRVSRLERAALDLAAGRQVQPIPVESQDELGRLTQAFNEMQMQLAQVDRARKEFIANASHELRTPIFSLGGFVELLQDEQLDPETRDEFLRAMREQVDRLQKLSVDLLDLSRLDAGSLASGSGLGLAIARELAERMDGRLEAESRPGHTVFRLVLPSAEAFSRENAAVVKS